MRTSGGVQRMRTVVEEVPHLQRPGQRHSTDLPLITVPVSQDRDWLNEFVYTRMVAVKPQR